MEIWYHFNAILARLIDFTVMCNVIEIHVQPIDPIHVYSNEISTLSHNSKIFWIWLFSSTAFYWKVSNECCFLFEYTNSTETKNDKFF